MTYNVHGCVGMDGKLSPRRIADCIAQYEPDIVALQELDAGRSRSGGEDQAMVIAEYLNMEHHFHATMRVAEGSFGDAILSDHPVALIKKEALSRYEDFSYLEPRGALWVEMDFNSIPIQIFDTHLGLNAKERVLHAKELLDKNWLGSEQCEQAAVLLCGDFNSMPGSKVLGLLQERLSSVQPGPGARTHKRTWFGRYPLATLDHIFISPHFDVLNVRVGDSYLARLASDHRPIFADLKIRTPTDDVKNRA